MIHEIIRILGFSAMLGVFFVVLYRVCVAIANFLERKGWFK